jgi:hypothetical protein
MSAAQEVRDLAAVPTDGSIAEYHVRHRITQSESSRANSRSGRGISLQHALESLASVDCYAA